MLKKKTAITTTSETLGCKKLDYEVPDTSSNLDTLTQLEVLRDSTDDDSVKAGLEKLSFAAQSGSFENPITEEKIPTKEKDIWP